MEDARESRRKRLAERKTDRLAFITGQNRTLAPFAPQDGKSSVGDLILVLLNILRFLPFRICHFSFESQNMFNH
ncbi:hypothetical protein MA16_Dca027523 [Dendrobium catenatum]|uniref:Uncharacterized protein n=1 Tax=Dendrobium catenatum TaxID=906689 RepID=A0A2I0W3L9_9ASPA|nr:hypothetical protein MA16_Dca027523 [Dendrobium catenatum]